MPSDVPLPKTPFDWTVREDETWPPKTRPKPPFGPTFIEVLRSCPLRGCFEFSKGYERRMSFAGRIGTAFHKALQSLTEEMAGGETPAELAEEARKRFLAEIARQETEVGSRPRERGLPREADRVHMAAEAVLAEAHRMAEEGRGAVRPKKTVRGSGLPEALSDTLPNEPVEVEASVETADGLIRGRVDRMERLPAGPKITDYKSAMRDDLPGRYARQVQLYALMWQETHGEWPVEGEVVYPLTGGMYRVPVDPALCEQVGEEAREIIAQLGRTADPYALALPGDTCKVCEFRPWCKPFWDGQAAEPSHSSALEQAALGFEGEIASVERIERYWRGRILWRGCAIILTAPEERFPHLRKAQVGDRVRVLEARLHGLRHEPRAIVSETTEIFFVEAGSSEGEEGNHRGV